MVLVALPEESGPYSKQTRTSLVFSNREQWGSVELLLTGPGGVPSCLPPRRSVGLREAVVSTVDDLFMTLEL